MMRITRTKKEWHSRSLLLVGVFTLLFHTIVPYYHPASATAVGGYMATVCTPNGSTTTYIALDDLQTAGDPGGSNSADLTLELSYFHCPACLVQLNAMGWMDSYGALFAENHSSAGAEWDAESADLDRRLTYPPFLIRGPPVFA